MSAHCRRAALDPAAPALPCRFHFSLDVCRRSEVSTTMPAARGGDGGHMIRVMVNGVPRDFAGDPRTPLVVVLRETLGFRETKFGCGQGRCGACTVIVEGLAVRSCQTPIHEVAGKQVNTIEGLSSLDRPHPVLAAIREAQGSQCGHCGAGIIMDVTAFLDRTPRPTEEQVREVVKSHECMCGSRSRVIKAVLRVIGTEGRH